MTNRRSFLRLLAALPMAASNAARAASAVTLPAISKKVTLAASPDRNVEVSVWRASEPRRGTILFSHGFGSSARFYPDWITAWVAAGFDVHAPLHTDSREYPLHRKFSGSQTWKARIEDIRAVSAAIGDHYVAAGHSYGALTALVAGGVRAAIPEGVEGPLDDPKARAVIAFSPPGPLDGLVTREAFAKLARPALIETGTYDVLPGSSDPEGWRAHFTAFAEAPCSGETYGMLLEGTDHYFGGLICDPSKNGPDQHLQLALATRASLAFLDRFAPPSTTANDAVPGFPRSSLARIYRR